MHKLAQRNEIRKRVESRMTKPLGWCRDERIRIGDDLPIMRVRGYMLVYCVKGMHAPCWIAWKPSGQLHAIGSAEWVRCRIHGLTYPRPGFVDRIISAPSPASDPKE